MLNKDTWIELLSYSLEGLESIASLQLITPVIIIGLISIILFFNLDSIIMFLEESIILK